MAKTKTRVRIRIQRDVPHFVRQWRKYRDMTIVELSEAASMSASMISQIETGKAQYTQPTLESLAVALEVHPATLLWIDPSKAEALQWSALLCGWRKCDDVPHSVLDVLISDNVEAAFRAVNTLKEKASGLLPGWRLP